MMHRLFGNRSNAAWLLIGLVVALVGGSADRSRLTLAATQATAAAESYPEEIPVAQAAAKKDAGAFFLDVRETNEWYQAHIPGSTLIPLGQLEKRVNELPRDKEIVVVCRSGGRSGAGRDVVRKAGFTQVTSMAGGLNGWKAADYPTVTGP